MTMNRDTVISLLTAALAVLLVWLPLPFGSVRPWAHDVLRMVAFMTFGVAVLAAGRGRSLQRAAVPAAAVALIAAVGWLQAIRWPLSWVETVAPGHAELAESLGGVVASAPISMAPAASRFSALTWLAVAACLLTAAVIGRSSGRRRVLLGAIVLSAAVQIVYGARLWMARSGEIWGVKAGGAAHRLRGTFVNPDHLAVYLEICLAAVLAWGWWAVRRARRETTLERRLGLVAPPVIAWLILFVSIAFTGSRAGLVAAVVGTTVQGSVLAFGRRGWSGWRGPLAAILAPAAGVLLVALIGLQAGLGRWLGTSQHELTWNGRLAAYDANLELWSRFPILGTGLGSFREAFPLVQPAEVGKLWIHAHNDWLEILATTGLVGAVIAAIGVAAVLLNLGTLFDHSHRTEVRAAGLAAVGAIAAVALHSCLDFGLTMPANAATLAILTGAAIGADRGDSRMTARDRNAHEEGA